VSPSSDFDRRLADWLDAQAPMHEPDGLSYAVRARTRRMRQLPGWASLERWLPMTVITRSAPSPPLRIAWLLPIGLLMVALVASVAIVGSRLLTSTGPDSGLTATAVIPEGDDAVFALSTYVGDIVTSRADGTDLRRLTDGPGTKSGPVWSPDGTRIAYHLWQDGADSLVVMDAGGGNSSTLATNSYPSEGCSDWQGLAWSPDGTSLTFPTRDGCEGAYDLSIVAADGSSQATRLLAPGTNSLHASWSPDGTRIAYLGSEGSGDVGLYVVETSPEDALSGDLQGRVIAPDLGPVLTNLANPVFGYVHSPPGWSPDGTQVAVAAVTERLVQPGFHIVNADGSGERINVEDAGYPTWSPDGQRLAFHRTVDPSEYFEGRPCTVRTWIIDADGGDERQLDETGDGCEGAPLWSPDGTRIATVLITSTPDAPEPGFHLGFVMVDGSTPPVVLDGFHGSWQPVVAPLPPAPSFSEASPSS
jgi:Tol biopolymer transport system component